jgi:hypothetical protein
VNDCEVVTVHADNGHVIGLKYFQAALIFQGHYQNITGLIKPILAQEFGELFGISDTFPAFAVPAGH